MHFAGRIQRFLGFLKRGLVQIAGITKPPGVLGERSARSQERLERGLVLEAGDGQLSDVVRLPKGSSVQCKECLERFLHRLLTVEGSVS